MSTQNQIDEQFMRRAIALARMANGHNQPNPRVGAVIVHQNRIIGEGFHQQYGQAHAEVNAVASVKDKNLLPKSSIYVTLEPCHHFGKTPPCVDLILKHQFKRVIIGALDPFPEVAGKSIEKLRAAGVEVKTAVLHKDIQWLNRRFFTSLKKDRPYIILKYAASKDNFMGRPGENLRISNALTKRLLHRWRAEESAILVGTNTALTDNPQLGNRLYFGQPPLRVVLDRQLKLPRSHKVFDGAIPTLIVSEKRLDEQRPNIEIVQLDFGATDFLHKLLGELHQRKLQSLIVEGGAALLQSFVQADLWDEVRVFRAGQLLKEGLEAVRIAPQYLKSTTSLGDNQLEIYCKEAYL